MKKFAAYLLLLMIWTLPAPCQANDEKSQLLINNFITALKTSDQSLILPAWEAINQDPVAKKYMEETSPSATKAFSLTELANQAAQVLQQFVKEIPEPLVEAPSITPTTPAAAIPAPLSNKDAAQRYPNQDQQSNQASAAQRYRAPLVDNATRTQSYPVQSALSNQDEINNRLKQMGLK